MNIFLSNSQKTVCFSEENYENGLQTDSKFAFLKIEEGHDPDVVLEYAKEQNWKFSAPNSAGEYTIAIATEEMVEA